MIRKTNSTSLIENNSTLDSFLNASKDKYTINIATTNGIDSSKKLINKNFLNDKAIFIFIWKEYEK